MKKIDNYFLSIHDDIFCPPILTNIKQYLDCEQVVIYKLDEQGELENIIYSSDYSPNHLNLKYKEIEQIDPDIVTNIIDELGSESQDEFDETIPLKKAKLAIPIDLKTPEIIALNNNISLWGVLLIYDFNYLRQWTETEKEFIDSVIFQITLGIERNIIYKKFKDLEKKINCYQIFDEQTNLINYSSFFDCLDYEWRHLARENKHLSLILIKINNEDNSDRQISNEIGQMIQAEIQRPADIVAHYSQNRIIILLPGTDNSGALWVNKKMIAKIEDNSHNGRDYKFLSSIVTCLPKLNQSYQSLLEAIEIPFKANFNSGENIYNQNLE